MCETYRKSKSRRDESPRYKESKKSLQNNFHRSSFLSAGQSKMRMALLMIISFSLPVFAQGTIDKHGRYIPTQEEIEASKRMAESLRSPAFIRLRLVFLNPNTDETSDLAPPYKSTDRIAIRVILSHYFNGPITIVE